MITGFNTDVEHDGVVYHVQTEDKGLDSPLILSLVYTGGAILASKRSPYDDLISSGFDERALSVRLQRQHKLICAAIRAGRIEDLKRMSQRDPPTGTRSAAASPTVKQQTPVNETPPRSAPQTVRAIMQETVADFARAVEAAADALHVSLLDEQELRGGRRVALRIRVGRGAEGSEAIPDAEVTVKVLGSTFRPLIYSTRTGADGLASVRAELPHFKTGRAAVLIRAVASGYEAELRRIIQQG
ncbi:MAG: hypothetical protein WCF57_16315 [Pyrinomonadaceae bacterium]